MDDTALPPDQHNNDSATDTPKEPASSLRKQQPDELAPFEQAGFVLIPLHAPKFIDRFERKRGKSPLHMDWRKRDYSSFHARAHMEQGKNVGVRLCASDLVIDYDPRHAETGDNPLERFCKDFGIDLNKCFVVHTSRGGTHVYLKKPADIKLLETHESYKGLDFKSEGRQMVAPGSVHPDGENYESDFCSVALEDTLTVPSDAITVLERPARAEGESGGGECTPEQLAIMLTALDPTEYKDQKKWLDLMMACHHATGGEGSEEFVEWSTSDPDYSGDRDIILRRWDSLHTEGVGLITVKTLYKTLHDKNRGDLIPRASAEEDFADEPVDEDDQAYDALTQLCLSWVWIAGPLCFIHRETLMKYDRLQWESLYAGYWTEKGTIVNAVWKSKLNVRKFESLVYRPDESEFPNDSKSYNIWRASGIEGVQGDVSWFTLHMEYMFPNEDDRDIVLDYLSLLVQQPSVKIHFALLIRGRQGTGKSAIGLLMRKIIGDGNTVEPNNDALSSQFTDWQEGKQLVIIHEMMMRGRVDVANHLKPVITEDRLRIEAKYLRAYTIENYLNLLCFTNHADAVHLEAEDRRWCVVHSPALPKDEAYYANLFSHINSPEGPAAVKFFLQERILKLNPKGRAPTTNAKEDMRELSMSDAEHFLLDRLEDNSYPFDFDLVRFEDVAGALTNAIQDREISCKSPRLAAKKFLKANAIQLSHNKKSGSDEGMNYRLWIIRNHFHWEEMGPTARAEAYKNKNKDRHKKTKPHNEANADQQTTEEDDSGLTSQTDVS